MLLGVGESVMTVPLSSHVYEVINWVVGTHGAVPLGVERVGGTSAQGPQPATERGVPAWPGARTVGTAGG